MIYLNNEQELFMSVIIDGEEFVTNTNSTLPLQTTCAHKVAASEQVINLLYIYIAHQSTTSLSFSPSLPCDYSPSRDSLKKSKLQSSNYNESERQANHTFSNTTLSFHSLPTCDQNNNNKLAFLFPLAYHLFHRLHLHHYHFHNFFLLKKRRAT